MLKGLFRNVLLFVIALWVPTLAFAVADNFEVTLPNLSPTAGVGDYLTITVKARNGGAYDDYSGTVTFSLTSGANTFAPAVSGAFSGSPSEWHGYLQVFAAGSQTITATGTGGITGSVAVDLLAGPRTGLLLVMPGQTYSPGLDGGVRPITPTAYQGVYAAVTLYAVDSYYNWVTGYAGSMNLNTVAGTISPGTSTTVTDGRAFFAVRFTSEGSVSLFSTVPSSATFYANVVNVSQVYLNALAPTLVVAGVPFPVTSSASYNINTPLPGVPMGSDSFRLYRYQVGTTTPATGNWTPDTPLQLPTGSYVRTYTYDRAEMINLRLQKLTSGGITSLLGQVATVEVQPNVPAALEVTVSPAEVQAQKSTQITARVLDAWGNPTRTALYPFVVAFDQLAGSGYLSVTRSTTDYYGVATSTFTGGIINEVAHLRVRVYNTFDASVMAESLQDVKISVAAAEPGSIVNYPNPFHPTRGETTSINYYLTSASEIEYRIYDAFGRLVLAKDFKPGDGDPAAHAATAAGGANITWDGKNSEGRTVANGIYQVRVKARGSDGTQQDFKRRVGVVK